MSSPHIKRRVTPLVPNSDTDPRAAITAVGNIPTGTTAGTGKVQLDSWLTRQREGSIATWAADARDRIGGHAKSKLRIVADLG